MGASSLAVMIQNLNVPDALEVVVKSLGKIWDFESA